ncbi:MAG: HIT domain-containing protein [Parcubacteria group bacterium]|nr:HIT domain-containing protein [Parcubacteria group bacterium]
MEKDCPFCNRETFKERIITETNEFFVIATLGQITDGGHVLVFPKRHVICMNLLTEKEQVKLTHLLLYVEDLVHDEYGAYNGSTVGERSVILFEHGIVGQTVKHAHLHIVPAHVDLTTKMLQDFPETLYEQFNFVTNGIPEGVGKIGDGYLLSRPPGVDQKTDIIWDPKGVPAQYFRTRLAEALGRPERANWRDMDPKIDRKLWSETVERLKKYFSVGMSA